MTPSTPSPTLWHFTNANITASDVKYSQSYPLTHHKRKHHSQRRQVLTVLPLTLHKRRHHSQWRQVLLVLPSDTPQTQTSQPVTANITASDVKNSQSYPLTLHKRKHHSQWRQVLPVLPSDTPQTQTSQPVTPSTPSPTLWHSTNANITVSDAKYSQSYPLTLHKRKHHSQWRQVLTVLPSDTLQTQTSQSVTPSTPTPTLWHSTNANITVSDAKYSQSYPLTLHKRKYHSQWRQILPVLPSNTPQTQTSQSVTPGTPSPTLWPSTNANITISDVKYSVLPSDTPQTQTSQSVRKILSVLPSDTPQTQTSQPVTPSTPSPTLWHSTNANITVSNVKYSQSYPLTLHKRKHHSQWRQILSVLPSDTPQTQTSQPMTSNTHSPTLWHSTNANITASDA